MILLTSGEVSRRPRLDDVAAEVGVSPATVSLVLRGIAGPSAATRERVLAAAARLGYRPDRAASVLASRRSRSIGVVMDIGNAFHAQLVEDVQEAAERHGYDLVLSTVTRSRDETRAVETLLDSRCDALVLLGSEAPADQLTALGRQLPVVVVGRPVPPAGFDVARAADDKGVGQAVEYLAGLGHRRISYVDGGTGTISALRRRGYRRAMRDLQLVDQIHVIGGGYTESAGSRAARVVLGRSPKREGQGRGMEQEPHVATTGSSLRPTAVLTFNDRAAIGLIGAFVRAGVDVPGVLSVVGYDDSPSARLVHVDLTTVSQNSQELTEHAVAAVVERLDGGRTDDREVVVAPRLVVRGTTGPPRQP